MPDLAVPTCEIAFTSPPADESPDWEDVSVDLRSFNYARGKQRELDRFQAGRASVTLNNKTRQYDPNNSAGDHYGDIKPQRRVRLTATYDEVTYPLIEGYVDSWDQQRQGPRTGDTVVSFTDGFKILNRAALASSPYVQEVLADEPVGFWRLDEPAGTATLFDSSPSLAHMTVAGNPTLGDESMISREPGSSLTTDDDEEGGYRLGALVTGSPLTVECVYQHSMVANSGNGLVRQVSFSSVAGFSLSSTTIGGINWTVAKTEAVFDTVTDVGETLADGLPHHIVAVWEADGDMRIYVDGADVTTAVDNVAPGQFSPQDGYVGIMGQVVGAQTGFGALGTIQMVALYDTELSAARIAAHAEAVATPWNNDTAEDRLGRVLDAVGWPAGRRDLDAGNITLQSATLGTSALEHVQKVAESEFGKVFISAAGDVRFISRANTWNQAAAGTLTDDQDYQASDPEYGDDLIRNDVTVSRSEGVAQQVRDLTSIGEYLISSYSLDGLYHDSDEHSLAAAQYILDVYKDPQQRISGLTVKPAGDPASLFPLLLGLELGDWIAIEETPQNTGSAVTNTCVVEGITVDWSPEDWTFDLALSPADTRPYWLAGVVGYSEAGVSTRAGF